MTHKLIVIGSLNMDLVVQLQRWPEAGETVFGRGYRTVPGGKGANQAVAAARQGAGVRMVGCVGQDEFGESLLESLGAAQVELSGVRRVASQTGVAMVAVEAGGENRIVVISGANGAVAVQHIEQEREAIAAADWLLLQLEIPLATNIAAAQVAHEVGTRVLLNPAPVPADGLPAELLAHVDLLVPNEGEALRLTAASTAQEAAKMLCAGGLETVIVTLGAEGALLADKDGHRQIAAFKVEPVDTTAAGDAFVGALAAALSFGKTIEQAVTYAAAAGALAVTKLGAQPSLPTLQAVAGLIAIRDKE